MEQFMPIYEFKCNECGEVFDEMRKIGDFNRTKCPKCGSKKTGKIFSLFAGSKSDSCGTSHSGG
jgi:putative FmdB family regulatory protein